MSNVIDIDIYQHRSTPVTSVETVSLRWVPISINIGQHLLPMLKGSLNISTNINHLLAMFSPMGTDVNQYRQTSVRLVMLKESLIRATIFSTSVNIDYRRLGGPICGMYQYRITSVTDVQAIRSDGCLS